MVSNLGEIAMDFQVSSGKLHKQRTSCLVLGVFEGRRFGEFSQQLDPHNMETLNENLKRGNVDGKVGQSLLLFDVPGFSAERILLVGCGKERQLDAERYLEIIKHSAKLIKQHQFNDSVLALSLLPVKQRSSYWRVRLACEAIHDHFYQLAKYKSGATARFLPRKTSLLIDSRAQLQPAEQALQDAQAIAKATAQCRDLTNMPSNLCTPSYLAHHAGELGLQDKVHCDILDEEALESLGANCLLAVGRGSAEPTKLIVLKYTGAKKSIAPIVLVGKGITYDTGGVNVKHPYTNMVGMHMDMGGAAAVLSTFEAVVELALPINLICVVAAAENMSGSQAYKPNDIITSLSGQTVEIHNTDAEGRIVLCDALTYCERFKPAVVIDVATLTGAAIVALGHQLSALMGNHQPLINELLSAGKQSLDEAWQLPINDHYQKQLNSELADMKNIGGMAAGSITAACFLARFTKKFKWAHLDIAGTSAQNNKATGRCVPLLIQYLIDYAH